jgi:hypothetical protein
VLVYGLFFWGPGTLLQSRNELPEVLGCTQPLCGLRTQPYAQLVLGAPMNT